ncbi:gamma-interferon-responsive lysosomal thiol protein isoform X2 [Beta vulgaris subsp. vulgaris]|uniref:gamma-interferon-responsive lysosomal thiol protein isoform X2 n=1 Tax=Beta vulgaris subsp. vulgaris TaxID=3555 RepID=UPI002037624E|nr:gamma-interferon-responsive lysosomal thiol protein isoform X2 [Beta vulgaris subsp. vulgaris]
MASLMRHCFSILVYLSFIQASLGSSNSAGKVPLDLYYESLCPYCANFIVNELPIIFKNGIIDIVDLRLFPWGNARLTSNNSFICQHGPNECLFNTVEACAIDAWPNLDDHFPFIKCVESQIHEGKYTQWATCFKELGLDPKPVTSCYNGAYGKQDYENFISYICKAYKGIPPSACKKASFASVVKQKTKNVRPISYNEHTTKLSFLMKIWSVITS